MKQALQLILALSSLITLVNPAAAHHSYSMFDKSQTITLDGAVKVFEWTNPHSWIIVLAKNKQGVDEEWTVETAAPGQLSRTGWKRNALKAGDKVKVKLYPLRTGALGGTLISVTKDDGQVYSDVAATRNPSNPNDSAEK